MFSSRISHHSNLRERRSERNTKGNNNGNTVKKGDTLGKEGKHREKRGKREKGKMIRKNKGATVENGEKGEKEEKGNKGNKEAQAHKRTSARTRKITRKRKKGKDKVLKFTLVVNSGLTLHDVQCTYTHICLQSVRLDQLLYLFLTPTTDARALRINGSRNKIHDPRHMTQSHAS